MNKTVELLKAVLFFRYSKTRKEKEKFPVRYVPTEDTISKMNKQDQQVYVETKDKITHMCEEHKLQFVSIEDFCLGFSDIEKHYSFARICELWLYSYTLELLAEKKIKS